MNHFKFLSDFDDITLLLQKGAVAILPTDTVYGLVTSVMNEQSVNRFYSLKQREQKPGTLIGASIEQLLTIGADPEEIKKVSAYWPNPLSAVITVHGYEFLHQDVGSLAMRVVADNTIRKLLQVTGPLITSSANQPGKPPATTLEQATAYFGDSVDFYVDGGAIVAEPSTIIRPSATGIEVLRWGSINP